MANMEFKELMEKFCKWLTKTITEARVSNDKVGYNWLFKDLEFEEEPSLEKFQEFFDRKSLNDEYKERYKEDSVKEKKPYVYIQNEINLIYSFHKCFAMRYATRLQVYRNDLAMKGARIPSLINYGIDTLEFRKEHFEQDK